MMLYHWEHIKGRGNGREYRVADETDNPICDFLNEYDATKFVDAHNMLHLERNPTWNYGGLLVE
jgi:hypothetical protein